MKVYLVGGAVRDALLSYPVVERDYVVVGSTPEEMLSLGYTQVGKDFPVFLHPQSKEEYALARTERKSGQGYTGFICEFNPSITLEEDLYRRDLTVNAIAQDEHGNIIDPYNGQQDLSDKVLRHVSPAFSEDPLRVLRVARFAARYHHLGFSVAEQTYSLMSDMVAKGELNTLTKERVWIEIEKCLHKNTIAEFCDVLNATNALPIVMPLLTHWDKNVSDELVQIAKRIKGLSDEVRPLALFSLWLQQAEPSALKGIEQSLKIPSSFANALRDLQTTLNTLQSPPLDADALLALFNALDIWRRPERLSLQCLILTGLPQYQQHTTILEQTSIAAQSISAQQVMALGFQGSAIKQGLETARRSAIESKLKNL